LDVLEKNSGDCFVIKFERRTSVCTNDAAKGAHKRMATSSKNAKSREVVYATARDCRLYETNQQVAPAPNSDSSSHVFGLGTSPTVVAVISEVKLTGGQAQTCLPKTQGEILPVEEVVPSKECFSCGPALNT
jgi:hypothetical protein